MKSLFQGAALAAFFLLSTASARSDEFALVPAGDPTYKQLAVLRPLGWISMRSEPKGPLTRYEIATEVGRAINGLRTMRAASPSFTPATLMRPGIRTVRELSEKFRPELRSLGIDAAEAIKLCDELLKGGAPTRVAARPSVPREESFSIAPRNETPSVFGRTVQSASRPTSENLRFAVPLSNRLRFESVVSKLARDAADPFGDTNDLASPNITRAGVALAVNHSVSLHAFGGRSAASRVPIGSPLADPNRALNTPSTAFTSGGGGVSLDLPRGVQLRGNYERLSASGGPGEWRRLGGELEVSAWSNRLSLRANWSRLLPNDARLLPSSAGGVDVGLSVSERLRLTLLYRQLFSESAAAQTNRVVSGGINIDF